MGTLWEALGSVPDRRTRKGRRYSLASVLGLSLAAMLCGANDLRAIFRWGRRLSPKALRALGIERDRAPCHAAYHYIFRSIAAEDLERALRGLVTTERLSHVAIDGKRLRGSQSEHSPGIHMLQAFAGEIGAAVGALVVSPQSAEAREAIELIKSLPLEGATVTGDAAFTYRPIIEALREKGADYFLLVKANQPELQAEIAHAFGDDSPLEDRGSSRQHRSPAGPGRPSPRGRGRQGARPHRDPQHRRAQRASCLPRP